ncbi:poly-beta-hydroxybutyrate polymerase [Clostridium acetireducens DSM 10703]|jgi:polyhydroxyalkanoate synthase|uniref:Poly(3-hydroxyalkanoate) polymerase subunit PhaC n=1 Tax=Clostridium acetireducens DSM 10703 TaxID=1121290 RepID=A0A1E8EW64_9CLOT|nr:class III poly(R)-hydroxyalkanoic acid synthase subunit PhaC [Clostridium acetireducens]OFI01499.1 poly-beta-hydroxybutyrate polymerase [Clostridium acetireducens DSM 10703]
MNFNYGIDMKASFKEMLEMQKKLISGMELMLDVKDEETDSTPKELVYEEDKMKLYHYKPLSNKVNKVPILITYALVNRYYMMDLQQDRSMIKNMLERGLDIYIIDWGYPTQEDMYLTMEDYIEGYMNNAVDYILKENNISKINLIGVCQGGTFSTIYAALNPDKVKNLITMVTPIEFDTNDGLLFKWGKDLNIDSMVDAFGVVPGDFMNWGYMLLKPFQLFLDKYVGVIENMDSPDIMQNFIRMEKWIFDSPGQAGETLREFVKELYQENKLVKGEFKLGDKKVDLNKINMPLLNVYADYDHLVPPASSRALNDLVSSKDKELIGFPVGHIGMFVSSRSKKEIIPKVSDWILKRS